MGEKNKIKYDSYNDVRFPVALLYKGLWTLKATGHQNFFIWARDVDMPAQDIERVLNKHKYATDPEFRKQIDEMMANIKKKPIGSDIEFEPPF